MEKKEEPVLGESGDKRLDRSASGGSGLGDEGRTQMGPDAEMLMPEGCCRCVQGQTV